MHENADGRFKQSSQVMDLLDSFAAYNRIVIKGKKMVVATLFHKLCCDVMQRALGGINH